MKTRKRDVVTSRKPLNIQVRVDHQGKSLKISQYYAENVFDFMKAHNLSEKIRREIMNCAHQRKPLPREYIDLVAEAVKEWAIDKGATHFCHWFQPLTGNSAEKQDSFLAFDERQEPIEWLSASALMQGEPDASSFPHGGVRTTFEARGYTIWDLTSPMFLREGGVGKILCIPTAFVSYTGDALDVKTPLLRSVSKLSDVAVRFLNLVDDQDVKEVVVTCGAEQEYFLIDKAFFYERPDLVMTGRTLLGETAVKNQQLSDHYFGQVPERVLAFMQDLDQQLYLLGIPSKTRHNEVAPGQFEVAHIFRDANLASDNNQTLMALLKSVAEKHDFIALLHEKPFSGINGSGKHLNWSLADNLGRNLLEPGNEPHRNYVFLAVCSIVIEAVHRHSELLRLSVATHSNDHRLGGHEAPPSIMSVFLGETLSGIYDSIIHNNQFTPLDSDPIDLGAHQLAMLLKDNTDRNRTSPFAFTGNRFEFRAVGSNQAVGFPLSILNAAVADVFEDACDFIHKKLQEGVMVDEALLLLCRNTMQGAWRVVFNGDGYSQEWQEEASKRGLPNLKTSADVYPALIQENKVEFLLRTGVYKYSELMARYNVLVDRYNHCRLIEFNTLLLMVHQYIIPSVLRYKEHLLSVIKLGQDLQLKKGIEDSIYLKLDHLASVLYEKSELLKVEIGQLDDHASKQSLRIAHNLLPLFSDVTSICDELEALLPDDHWSLPKYYDMLFIR